MTRICDNAAIMRFDHDDMCTMICVL